MDEDNSELSTMKLSIACFISKLENYIDETNVTDENMLNMMSHLTNCIDLFVSGAKVIKTNHLIEPELYKNILTSENIFGCHLCNVQTGKTYNTLINHIRSKKHIAHVRKSEQMIKTITPKPVETSINNPVTSIRVETSSTFSSPVSINMGSVFNTNLPKELKDSQCQVQNAPLASVNNNNSAINGFANNVTYSPDYLRNYKDLFKMPSPDSVIGFQQNIVNPSNNFFLNEQKIKSDDESDEPEQHFVSKIRKRNRNKRRTKKMDNKLLQNDVTLLDKITVSFLMGNFEINVAQFMAAAQSLSNKDLYACITSNLKKCCEEMHLNVEVGYFGSRVIDIGTNKSDIDLNITVTDSSKIDENFLQDLQNILQKDSNWSNAIYIKSRVSLVRAHNIEMNIDCDITFNNDLAMTNTELVKYYYTIQPECHKVAVFIRIWAEKVNLYPHMNTYTMNLLVFYYCQVKGYLPKVVDLIDASSTNNFWPNKFHCKSLSELSIEKVTDFKATCLDFMDFYAHRVNFNAYVLSVFTGSALPKELFGTEVFFQQNDCYQGLSRHMDENPRAASCIKVNFSMAMCVQDPFAHDHNVTRCMGKSYLKRFKDYCHETHKILKGLTTKEILNDVDNDS